MRRPALILTSQGYDDKSGCRNGIESVRKNGPNAAMFEKKSSSDGKFYFLLKAGNGQVIGTSQRYASEAACDNGIESVQHHAADAKLVEG